MEVGPHLEVTAREGFGQEKRGQGEAEMVIGQGLEETGLWTESSWRRGLRSWRWPRAVCGGRHWERL